MTEEIENLKKDLKYVKETLKAMTPQQWLAIKEELNDNTKEIEKQKKKELKITTILNLTNTRKQK